MKIWEIIHKGSYPELYDVKRDWEDYYSSYVATYLERDMNEFIMSDSVTFTKLLICVAARTGEILNYANIVNEVGVSEPTIKKRNGNYFMSSGQENLSKRKSNRFAN